MTASKKIKGPKIPNTIKVPKSKTKNGQQLLSPSVSEAEQESDQTSKGVV